MKTMIKIKELVHRYTVWESETQKNKKTVLDGISVDIPSGQFIAILGPNGSGKSTLAKHLNVLLLPDEGTVWIDGKDTADQEKLWAIREEVGMVFQNPDNQIIGTSVEEDVAFGPENRNLSSEEIREKVTDSLREVQLLHKRRVSPARWSGGQKQRVAIAGTLAGSPSCIVLDEPTAMLDPNARKEVMKVIRRLNREKGITIILITHHTDEVVDADTIILMNQGKIVQKGTPGEIFADTELLKTVKMDLPQVTELADKLKKNGVPIQTPILHEKEFLNEMRRLDSQRISEEKKRNEQYREAENAQEPQEAELLLKAENLRFSYGKGTVNACEVIKDISCSIYEGEFLGVIGSSGTGKTTLIKLFNGLLRADEGNIFFKKQNIYDKKYPLSRLRKEVGLVFQYPEQQLFGRTVLADASFGPMNLGMSREEAQKSAKECLRLVGIGEEYDSQSPFELSGGQKRCVAIAGVLAMQPKILIMDEPAAGLDPETKHMIFRLIEKIKKEKNIAIVLISHHMEDVAEYADRVLVLAEGKVLLEGTPEAVYTQTALLREAGVGVPQITSLTEKMKREGIAEVETAVTVRQAERMIMTWWKGEKTYDS